MNMVPTKILKKIWNVTLSINKIEIKINLLFEIWVSSSLEVLTDY